jgi:hypothetical protein
MHQTCHASPLRMLGSHAIDMCCHYFADLQVEGASPALVRLCVQRRWPVPWSVFGFLCALQVRGWGGRVRKLSCRYGG